jgi:hypothetical protein
VSGGGSSGRGVELSLSSSFWVQRRTNKASRPGEADAEYRRSPTFPFGSEAVAQFLNHRMTGYRDGGRSRTVPRVALISLIETIASSPT